MAIGSCTSVDNLLPQTHFTQYLSVLGHLINSVCCGSGAALRVVSAIVGAEIFLRPDRRSANQELIIGQHTAHGPH